MYYALYHLPTPQACDAIYASICFFTKKIGTHTNKYTLHYVCVHVLILMVQITHNIDYFMRYPHILHYLAAPRLWVWRFPSSITWGRGPLVWCI